MDASTRFDTTCPSCNQTFEIDASASEGNCPFCQTHLKFLEEAPQASEGTPQLAPGADIPSFAPSNVTTTSPADEASAPPRPEQGAFSLSCPVCATSFHAGAGDDRAACPGCGASLILENLYARGPESFPVTCPSCQRGFEVTAQATAANCPGCGSALALSNLFPGDELALTPEPPAAPGVPAQIEAVQPGDVPSEVPAASAASKPPRGRFRRFSKTPSQSMEAPKPADPNLPPRVVEAPAQGLPYVLSCPTCNKEFSVGAKEREGNCPHCNAPLAFLTDTEYDALKEAEERKKAFQAKLVARKLEKKKRDDARAAELSERRAKREASPSSLASRLPSILKPKPKRPAAEPVPSPPPEAAVPPVPEAAAAEPVRPKRLFGRKPKVEKPAVAVEPPTLELSGATEISTPAKEEAPLAALPKKKGLLSRLGRVPKEPAPAPAAAAVEETTIDLGAVDARPAAPPPALTAAAAELLEPSEPQPSTVTKAAKGSRKKTPKAEPAPVPVAPAPSPTATIEMGGIDMGANIDIAASPAAPPPAKQGFFGRFKKNKSAPPAAVVEPASIDVAGIDFANGPGVAEPAAPAAQPAKKAPAKKKR